MKAELRILSQSEVQSVVAAGCGLPPSSPSERQREQVVADYLRQVACSFGRAPDAQAGQAFTPVHVNRILATVRKQLGFWFPPAQSPLWEEEASDEDALEHADLARRTLQKLVFLKECGHTGNGYYLPTPLRLVELPVGSLLLGGVPTRLAEQKSGVSLRTAGLARVVRRVDHEKVRELGVPSQPFAQWLGLPELPLAAWTDALLEEGRRRLRPSASESKFFSVYLPEAASRTYQYFRWLPAQQWSGTAERLYLCRTEDKPRRYWLGQLHGKGDAVRVEREATVPRAVVRRLQYGLDRRAGASVFARFCPQDKQSLMLFLQNWPALEELRLLFALSQQTSVPGRWPLAFEVQQEWRPTIENALRGLGMEIYHDAAEPPPWATRKRS